MQRAEAVDPVHRPPGAPPGGGGPASAPAQRDTDPLPQQGWERRRGAPATHLPPPARAGVCWSSVRTHPLGPPGGGRGKRTPAVNCASYAPLVEGCSEKVRNRCDLFPCRFFDEICGEMSVGWCFEGFRNARMFSVGSLCFFLEGL